MPLGHRVMNDRNMQLSENALKIEGVWQKSIRVCHGCYLNYLIHHFCRTHGGNLSIILSLPSLAAFIRYARSQKMKSHG